MLETFKTIFSSAAKIVFLMLSLTSCIAFAMGKLDAKDFMTLSLMSFAFYFGTPSNPSPPQTGFVGGEMK
jgi:hypothetical protein